MTSRKASATAASPVDDSPSEPVSVQVSAARRQLIMAEEAGPEGDRSGPDPMIDVGVACPESRGDYSWWNDTEGGSDPGHSGGQTEIEEMEFGQCSRCLTTLTAVLAPAESRPSQEAVAHGVWEHVTMSAGCRCWQEEPLGDPPAMQAWQKLAKWARLRSMPWRPQAPCGAPHR